MHQIITLIAKDFIVLPPIILAVVWFRLSWPLKRQAVLVAIGGVVITVILALIGSKLFNNPRPFVAGNFTPYFAHGNDNGFPSDHTLLAGLIGWLALCYSRKFGAIVLSIAALIGASRVIAGVHHFSDIIGALVISGIGVGISWLVIQKMQSRRA